MLARMTNHATRFVLAHVLAVLALAAVLAGAGGVDIAHALAEAVDTLAGADPTPTR